jgi:hypothetical protein
VLSLGNGPGAGVFVGPERPSRVDQENFEISLSAAVKEQAGALFTHVQPLGRVFPSVLNPLQEKL